MKSDTILWNPPSHRTKEIILRYVVNSDVDKEANTLKDSVGYAENFNKTKEINGISRKVGHSYSCLAFYYPLEVRPKEYINQVLRR